jgi:hypothetical protein
VLRIPLRSKEAHPREPRTHLDVLVDPGRE